MFIRKVIYLTFLALMICSSSSAIEQTLTNIDSVYVLEQLPSTATFSTPKGWRIGDKNALSRHVQIMVVGMGKGAYPPSLNLAAEKFSGSLKEYLKIVKKVNDSQKNIWKDLGPIRTLSGSANLSQKDVQTEWGLVRMMHAIIVKNQVAYILTAAALADEFSLYYQDFSRSIQSLQINKDLYETITDSNRRLKLKKINKEIETNFNKLKQENPSKTSIEIFERTQFQKEYWNGYKDKIREDFFDMGEDWQDLIFSTVQSSLTKNEKT